MKDKRQDHKIIKRWNCGSTIHYFALHKKLISGWLIKTYRWVHVDGGVTTTTVPLEWYDNNIVSDESKNKKWMEPNESVTELCEEAANYILNNRERYGLLSLPVAMMKHLTTKYEIRIRKK